MGLLSAAAGLIGGALSGQSARSAQMRQERYTERQMQNAHQWEVEDLKKAGLNPVLSAHSASAVGGAGGQATDFANAINGGITAGAQAQSADSQTQLNSAMAAKAIQETKGLPQQIKNETTKAQASATMASAAAAEVDANINRIKALLPGELKEQGLQIALKAQQGKLNESEMATLEKYGLTKSQMIQLGKMASDIIGDAIGGFTKFGTAKKFIENQSRNQRITKIDKRGEIKGEIFKEFYK